MKTLWKIIKTLFKVIFWIVLLLIILAVVAYFCAGKLIQHFAPEFISQVTQTETALGDVDISLFSGRVGLNNLTIGSPAGFKNKNIFELGKVAVQFDPKSVFTDKIVINNVQVSGLNVASEVATNGETNIQRLMKNIEKFSASDAPAQKQPAAKPTEQQKATADSEGPAVVIKDLTIDNSSLNLALAGLPEIVGSGVGASIPLPEIHMQNIGENKKQSFADTMVQILTAVNVESAKATAKAVKEAATKTLQGGKDAISGVTDMIKSFF
ncbi:MAG: AsmA family protein [Alphaproteobacteria bacterium]|nr:AsmA family protein [Alphaproteobacteria bacterium]